MKQQEVFKKIGAIIKELNEQYDYLGTSDEPLNDLELELFVANAHFLAEHSEVLRKLNLKNNPAPAPVQPVAPTPPPEVAHEEKYFEPVVQYITPETESKAETKETLATLPPDTPAEPIEEEVTDNHTEYTPAPHIDLLGNGADDDFSYVRQEPETIRHELILDESQNWEEDDEGFLSDETPETEEEETTPTPPVEAVKPEPIKTEPVKPEPPKPEPIKPAPDKPAAKAKAEEPAEEPLTINQKLSAQLGKQDTRVTEQLHTQIITDLKQAINLNDKLLYIKDLFNGYNIAYSEAIEIVNRFSSFEEAEKYLQKTYAAKNHWESKQGTVDKFYALLRRKYS